MPSPFEFGDGMSSLKPRVAVRIMHLEKGKPLQTTHDLSTLSNVDKQVAMCIVQLEKEPPKKTKELTIFTQTDMRMLMVLQRRKEAGEMKLEKLLKMRGIAEELWV
jgi:hypothetical protein